MIHVKVKAGVGWHDASMVQSAPIAGLSFDSDLIRKYDCFGTRYTSSPTADRSTEAFMAEHLANLHDADALPCFRGWQLSADDGLAEIASHAIHVRPRGRLLVRNVAMVFDRYLREQREAVRYSRII